MRILNTHHEEPSAAPRPRLRLACSECVLMVHTNFNASNAPLPQTGQITLSVPVPCQRCHSARARRARAPAGGGSRKEGGEAEKGGERGRGRGGTTRRDGVQPVLPARCVLALCLRASTVCAQLACAAAIFACRAGRPPARAPHLPLALILAVDQGPIVVGGCGATGGSANRALLRGRDES